jgi:hypothetical protein
VCSSDLSTREHIRWCMGTRDMSVRITDHSVWNNDMAITMANKGKARNCQEYRSKIQYSSMSQVYTSGRLRKWAINLDRPFRPLSWQLSVSFSIQDHQLSIPRRFCGGFKPNHDWFLVEHPLDERTLRQFNKTVIPGTWIWSYLFELVPPDRGEHQSKFLLKDIWVLYMKHPCCTLRRCHMSLSPSVKGTLQD